MFSGYETAIIERLRARLDSSIKVLSLSELARVPELRQKAPAVFVVFEGYSPADSTPNIPHIQQVEQRWSVVVAAKNATGGGETNAAKADASDIATNVLTALLGFSVAPGVRLKLTAAPGPEYEGGFAYLPIGFSCRATFKGDPV